MQLRQATARASLASTVLRVPGIYAADRLPLARLAAAVPALRADDDVVTNHIHADDLARASRLAVLRARPQRTTNVVDTTDLKLGDYLDRAGVAQLVEQRIRNAKVVGSTPISGTSPASWVRRWPESAASQGFDDLDRQSSTDSVVWSHNPRRSGIGHLQPRDILDGLDEMDAVVGLPHRAFDLGMTGVADHHHLPTLAACMRDTSTCTLVTSGQVASKTRSRAPRHRSRTARDTPWAEKMTGRPGRHLVQLVDEHGPLAAQVGHDMIVVHDLVPHIDGGAP
jgi:hypothetical protein